MLASGAQQYTYSLKTHKRISEWCRTTLKLGIFEPRRFGAFLSANSNDEPGIVVTHIEPDSFADTIGLRPSDTIVSIDGEELFAVCDFGLRFCSQGPDALRLKVLRKSESSEDIVDILVPGANETYGVGIELESIAGRTVVADVAAGSPAAKAGIYEGDFIVSIGSQIGGGLEALRAALLGKACTVLKICVTRNGQREKHTLSVLRLVREGGALISQAADASSVNSSESESGGVTAEVRSEATNRSERGSSVGHATAQSSRWEGGSVDVPFNTSDPNTRPPSCVFGAVVSKHSEGGLLVSSVTQGGVAQAHGLRPSDVILKIDGEHAETPQQLSQLFARVEEGGRMSICVQRVGGQILDVEISAKTATAALCGVGMSIDRDKSGSYRVTAVSKSGAAHASGVQVSDVISSVESVSLFRRSLAEVRQMIIGKPGTTVKLGIVRHGLLRSISVKRAVGSDSTVASPPQQVPPSSAEIPPPEPLCPPTAAPVPLMPPFTTFQKHVHTSQQDTALVCSPPSRDDPPKPATNPRPDSNPALARDTEVSASPDRASGDVSGSVKVLPTSSGLNHSPSSDHHKVIASLASLPTNGTIQFN